MFPCLPDCNNPPMQHLRNAKLIARFVLVWFALSLGVAIASPLVSPKSMQLICSGAAFIKVVSSNADGTVPADSHTLDCPLCAGIGLPPSVAVWKLDPVQPLAYASQGIASAHIAAISAAALPPRGPPTAV